MDSSLVEVISCISNLESPEVENKCFYQLRCSGWASRDLGSRPHVCSLLFTSYIHVAFPSLSLSLLSLLTSLFVSLSLSLSLSPSPSLSSTLLPSPPTHRGVSSGQSYPSAQYESGLQQGGQQGEQPGHQPRTLLHTPR